MGLNVTTHFLKSNQAERNLETQEETVYEVTFNTGDALDDQRNYKMANIPLSMVQSQKADGELYPGECGF